MEYLWMVLLLYFTVVQSKPCGVHQFFYVSVCVCVWIFVNIPTLNYKKLGGGGWERWWWWGGDHIPKSFKFFTMSVFLVGWEEGESFAGFKWFIIFIWNEVVSWIIHFSATADGIKSNSFCTIVSLPRPFLSLYIHPLSRSLYIQIYILSPCVILVSKRLC